MIRTLSPLYATIPDQYRSFTLPMTRLVNGPSRDLKQVRVVPQRLGLDEIDTVLAFVSIALGRIELKVCDI